MGTPFWTVLAILGDLGPAGNSLYLCCNMTWIRASFDATCQTTSVKPRISGFWGSLFGPFWHFGQSGIRGFGGGLNEDYSGSGALFGWEPKRGPRGVPKPVQKLIKALIVEEAGSPSMRSWDFVRKMALATVGGVQIDPFGVPFWVTFWPFLAPS